MQGDNRGAQPLRRLTQLLLVPRPRDFAPKGKGRACLGGHQIDAAEHSKQLALGSEDANVADVLVEHLQHHVGAGSVRIDGGQGSRYDLAHRRIYRHPLGHNPGADVAVRDDSQLSVLRPYDHRVDVLVRHHLGHLAKGAIRRAGHRLATYQGPGWLLCHFGAGDVGLSGRAPRLAVLQQRPRQIRQARSPRQQRDHIGSRHRIAAAVLLGARLESERQTRQHRGVSKQLPLPEHVDDPAVIDQLDRPSSHHQHPALRPLALLEDGGPRLEVLHVDPLDNPLQCLVVESAERVMRSQELRDVVHPTYLTVGTVIQNLKGIDCTYKFAHSSG
jgi:hypothetical protein